MTNEQCVSKTQEYLRGKKVQTNTLFDCANQLFDARKFSYARRLLARLYQEGKLDLELKIKWAVATCKDDDQPGETRFDEAITIIEMVLERDDIPENGKSRVLGTLGSIYKQKWRFDNQEIWLKTALTHLMEGYDLWRKTWKKLSEDPKKSWLNDIEPDSNFFDQGYCAINAAYVCDTLGFRQIENNRDDKILQALYTQLHEKATEIRNDIVEYCNVSEEYLLRKWGEKEENKSKRRWFYSTWAEALMGISAEGCSKAVSTLIAAKENKRFQSDTWMSDSASQQIANWISEDHFAGDADFRSKAEDVFKEMVGPSNLVGNIGLQRNERLGLALSGGGFRAALFHIGVLARLAEEDMLRKVEVISCVSGGSIIGAYYYLKVRKLLSKYPDSRLTKACYVKLVQEIENDFLDAINYDLRSNLFRDFFKDLKMAFSPGYSRTSRLADLYEEKLFSKILDKKAEAIQQNNGQLPKDFDPCINMTDLLIEPMGENDVRLPNQSPRYDNWKRDNKLPVLVLNATTLNTGHCWQFTAKWMGEPPGYINNETDALPTLRRMYYKEAPDPHKKVRLATAVAASSCVPAIFKPIQLKGLYEDQDKKRIDVELVDGGVYDNQGINTLLEQECTTLIISDASGQLASVDDPSSGTFSVTGRTNSILQERIRASQLSDLMARYNSKMLKGYYLMHLTKGLPSEVVNWKNCDDPYEPNFKEEQLNDNNVLTVFGIRKNIQQALARIRTDLDSFHEKEAYMLMLSGYFMTNYELEFGEGSGKKAEPKPEPSSNEPENPSPTIWKFKQVKTLLDDPEQHGALQKLLEAGRSLVKIQKVSPLIQKILWTLFILSILAGGWKIHRLTEGNWCFTMFWVLSILTSTGALIGGYLYFYKRLGYNLFTIILGLILSIPVSFLSWALADWFNRIYLRAGKLPEQQGPTDPA